MLIMDLGHFFFDYSFYTFSPMNLHNVYNVFFSFKICTDCQTYSVKSLRLNLVDGNRAASFNEINSEVIPT